MKKGLAFTLSAALLLTPTLGGTLNEQIYAAEEGTVDTAAAFIEKYAGTYVTTSVNGKTSRSFSWFRSANDSNADILLEGNDVFTTLSSSIQSEIKKAYSDQKLDYDKLISSAKTIKAEAEAKAQAEAEEKAKAEAEAKAKAEEEKAAAEAEAKEEEKAEEAESEAETAEKEAAEESDKTEETADTDKKEEKVDAEADKSKDTAETKADTKSETSDKADTSSDETSTSKAADKTDSSSSTSKAADKTDSSSSTSKTADKTDSAKDTSTSTSAKTDEKAAGTSTKADTKAEDTSSAKTEDTADAAEATDTAETAEADTNTETPAPVLDLSEMSDEEKTEAITSHVSSAISSLFNLTNTSSDADSEVEIYEDEDAEDTADDADDTDDADSGSDASALATGVVLYQEVLEVNLDGETQNVITSITGDEITPDAGQKEAIAAYMNKIGAGTDYTVYGNVYYTAVDGDYHASSAQLYAAKTTDKLYLFSLKYNASTFSYDLIQYSVAAISFDFVTQALNPVVVDTFQYPYIEDGSSTDTNTGSEEVKTPSSVGTTQMPGETDTDNTDNSGTDNTDPETPADDTRNDTDTDTDSDKPAGDTVIIDNETNEDVEGPWQEDKNAPDSEVIPAEEGISSTYTAADKTTDNTTLAKDEDTEAQISNYTLDSTARSFIYTYCANSDGAIYTQATTSNYRQILNGYSTWKGLTTNQKGAINEYLEGVIGMSYPKLYVQANRIRLGLTNTSSTTVGTGSASTVSSGTPYITTNADTAQASFAPAYIFSMMMSSLAFFVLFLREKDII